MLTDGQLSTFGCILPILWARLFLFSIPDPEGIPHSAILPDFSSKITFFFISEIDVFLSNRFLTLSLFVTTNKIFLIYQNVKSSIFQLLHSLGLYAELHSM